MDCLSVEEAQVLISKVNGAAWSAEEETAVECDMQSRTDPSDCPEPGWSESAGRFIRQEFWGRRMTAWHLFILLK